MNNKKLIVYTSDEYDKALKEGVAAEFPRPVREADYCGFCGKYNDFWDDCGFIYVVDYRREDWRTADTLPVCESCYHGEPGYFHSSKYGVGL